MLRRTLTSRQFVNTCAKTVIEQNPADVEALTSCKAAGSDMTVEELLTEKILTIGENIKIRRFARYGRRRCSPISMAAAESALWFNLTPTLPTKRALRSMAKDVAMQVAAANPSYLQRG